MADKKIEWVATAVSRGLKHGEVRATLDEPITMHLQMEPGTDGFGGRWVPLKGNVSRFPDRERFHRALSEAASYPFEIDPKSVCVHEYTETLIVTINPPIAIPS